MSCSKRFRSSWIPILWLNTVTEICVLFQHIFKVSGLACQLGQTADLLAEGARLSSTSVLKKRFLKYQCLQVGEGSIANWHNPAGTLLLLRVLLLSYKRTEANLLVYTMVIQSQTSSLEEFLTKISFNLKTKSWNLEFPEERKKNPFEIIFWFKNFLMKFSSATPGSWQPRIDGITD